MKKDHHGAVKKIAKFIGFNLKEEVIDTVVKKSTFQSMKDNPTTNPNIVEPIPSLYDHYSSQGNNNFAQGNCW